MQDWSCLARGVASSVLHVPVVVVFVVVVVCLDGPLAWPLAGSVCLVDGFGLGFCWMVVRAVVLGIATNVGPLSASPSKYRAARDYQTCAV